MKNNFLTKISAIMAVSFIFCLTFSVLGDSSTDQGDESIKQSVALDLRGTPPKKENEINQKEDKNINTSESKSGTDINTDKGGQEKDNNSSVQENSTKQNSTQKPQPYGRMFKSGPKKQSQN